MSDLLPITLADQIASVEREIALRKRVYPRWVDQGKMKPLKAEREIEVMSKVAETLNRLAKSTAITDEQRAYIAGLST